MHFFPIVAVCIVGACIGAFLIGIVVWLVTLCLPGEPVPNERTYLLEKIDIRNSERV